MKLIEQIAHIFSIAFIPLLIPTYAIIIALWGTYLDFTSLSTRLTVVAVVFAFTTMLPAIFIYLMFRMGFIKDAGLNERTDRFIPIIITSISYIGIAFYLNRINAPEWLSLFMIATALGALTMLFVSLRWKISGHAMGVGGLCAFIFILCYRNYTMSDSIWLFVASVIVAGIVCSSRLILKRHTLAQVVAGFFNGVYWIVATELIV